MGHKQLIYILVFLEITMGIQNKYFVDDSNVIIVNLSEIDEGSLDWIKIRQLSVGDREKITEAAWEVTFPAMNREQRRAARNTSPNIAIKAATIKALSLSIVDWSFTNGNNEKIPISPETIAKLKPSISNFLEEKIEELNPTSWKG
jgi:hypothetical protein